MYENYKQGNKLKKSVTFVILVVKSGVTFASPLSILKRNPLRLCIINHRTGMTKCQGILKGGVEHHQRILVIGKEAVFR
jgi:hypothetical protein